VPVARGGGKIGGVDNEERRQRHGPSIRANNVNEEKRENGKGRKEARGEGRREGREGKEGK
jgi:hypothetical protein